MERFTVKIDLELEEIQAAWKHFFGQKKKPTRREIGEWIANLATADIESEASHITRDED